jgi:hypothetical protein
MSARQTTQPAPRDQDNFKKAAVVEGAIRGRAATFDRLSEAAQRCGDSETRSVCFSRRLKGKLANLAGSRQAQPLGTVDVGVGERPAIRTSPPCPQRARADGRERPPRINHGPWRIGPELAVRRWNRDRAAPRECLPSS